MSTNPGSSSKSIFTVRDTQVAGGAQGIGTWFDTCGSWDSYTLFPPHSLQGSLGNPRFKFS